MGVFKAVGDGVAESDLVSTDYTGAQKALTGKYAFIKVWFVYQLDDNT